MKKTPSSDYRLPLGYQGKGDIHPLPTFLKEHYGITWREFADILKDRLHENSYEITYLSPSNVRNYACGQSHTWWFWPEIGEMALEIWIKNRKNKTGYALYQTDLKFGSLFSEELRYVISFFYHSSFIPKDLKQNDAYEKAESSILVICNYVLNNIESFYNISLPDFDYTT